MRRHGPHRSVRQGDHCVLRARGRRRRKARQRLAASGGQLCDCHIEVRTAHRVSELPSALVVYTATPVPIANCRETQSARTGS